MATPLVRLAQFAVSGFRSCRDVKFDLKRDLSILIGVNGSGKSNLLQAMRLPTQIVRSWRQDRPTSPATCTVRSDYKVGNQIVAYQAQLTYALDERGYENVSRSRESWRFPGIKGMDQWIEIPSGFADDLEYLNPTAHMKNRMNIQRSGRIVLHYNLPKFRLSKKAIELIREISKFNRGITYYSASLFTNPSRCPNHFEIETDGTLRTSYAGETRHRQFLHDLYRTYKTAKPEYDEFLAVVGENGIGLIDKISWREVKVLAREVAVRAGGKVVRKKKEGLLVIPTMRVKGLRLGPSQLSEGTFKSLALLYYLLSDKSQLMLLEEPEVCVHHGLLTSILEVIKSCSSRKQIVFSTHSEFVLDAVSPEQVYLVRHYLSKGTKVRELSKSMSARNYRALKEYLNTTGNLGEYVRHGGIII